MGNDAALLQTSDRRMQRVSISMFRLQPVRAVFRIEVGRARVRDGSS
jgi:hypothetical protein